MIDLDTPTQKRAARLKAPTSSAFDAAAWTPLLNGNPSNDDLQLITGAMLLGADAAAFRLLPKDTERDALDAATETGLCVATVNAEYVKAMNLSVEAAQEAIAAGAFAYGHVTGTPFETGLGQKIDALSVIDTSVDAVESWLFDIDPAKTANGAPIADLQVLAARTARRYSVQYGLNLIWKQCLWEGWRPNVIRNVTAWEPQDLELATLLEASRVRQAENFMNFPHIDQKAWEVMTPEGRRTRALPRTVVHASAYPRWRVKVGRPDCASKYAPPFVIERAGLEGSYLVFFLDHTLPNLSGRTCRDLLAAWHVILDLAVLLAKECRSMQDLTLNSIARMSLQISDDELRRILQDALRLSAAEIQGIVEFFTFKPKVAGQKGTRGLWAAPLVPIPGQNSVALVLPVLAASNPLRKVEMWLEKGGLDDGTLKEHRGGTYESEYRNKLRGSIADNRLFSDVRCAERGIKKDTNFGEEIDLLVRLGDQLIVGEVKCWLFPADPFERFQYFKKLKSAAEQALRKAKALQARPDVAAKALNLEESDVRALKTVPIVVVNQGFGFSLAIEGCRVVDAAFLNTYLGAGSIVSGMTIGRGQTNKLDHIFYNSEKQAADRFESVIAKPSVLYRFVERIKRSFILFPSSAGKTTALAVFNLEDVKGDERLLGQLLASA